MQITTIFEGWLLGDGSYPPMFRGQLVNLAFQICPRSVHYPATGQTDFESRDDGTCRLHGTVTWLRPANTNETPVAIVDAGIFRGYVSGDEVQQWESGASVTIEGELHVDYYIWSEFLADQYPDAPNLFYPFRVARIRRAWIPERFIARTERSQVSPATVPLEQVSSDDVEEVETMVTADDAGADTQAEARLADYRPSFFLVDLEDDDLPLEEIPHTFH
jgi:hypothetical protein